MLNSIAFNDGKKQEHSMACVASNPNSIANQNPVHSMSHPATGAKMKVELDIAGKANLSKACTSSVFEDLEWNKPAAIPETTVQHTEHQATKKENQINSGSRAACMRGLCV